jgi:hypothetical protein
MIIMICLFDKCELVNGLLLGVFSSIIATLIVLGTISFRNKKKFSKAVGEYLGYGYIKNKDNQPNDLIISDEPHSKVIITYLKQNQLRIELTDLESPPKNKWIGTVFMELENYGSIAWKYDIYKSEKIGGNKHKFGFKRLIINDSMEGIYIYLISENIGSGETYYNEVLKNVNNNTRT